MEREDLTRNPFDEMHLQWFAEEGEAGGESSGGKEGGEPPAEELKADGTFLAQAPDKYKKDQAFLKELLPLKSWGGVLEWAYGMKPKLQDAPEKPEGYEFDEVKVPEYLADEKHKAFADNLSAYIKSEQEKVRAWAHELGIGKAAAKRIAAELAGMVFNQAKAAQDEQAKQREAGLKALREEWKGDFDKNQELSKRALLTFGGQELVDKAEKMGLGDDPDFIKFLHKVGAAMGEDQLVPGATGKKQPTADEKKRQALKDRYPRSPEMHALDGGSVGKPNEATLAELEKLKQRYPKMGGAA